MLKAFTSDCQSAGASPGSSAAFIFYVIAVDTQFCDTLTWLGLCLRVSFNTQVYADVRAAGLGHSFDMSNISIGYYFTDIYYNIGVCMSMIYIQLVSMIYIYSSSVKLSVKTMYLSLNLILKNDSCR